MRRSWGTALAVASTLAVAGGAVAAPAADAAQAPAAEARPAREPGRAWCDRVVELSAGRRSGVTTARTANGVVVHHRRTDRSSGQVVVTVSLAGGETLEGPATRGLTQVLAALLDEAATAAPASFPDLDRLGGRIDAFGGADALQFRLRGPPAALDAMLAVAAELLTAPRLDAGAVEAARAAVVTDLRRRAGEPRAAIDDALVDAVFPAGELRARPLDERRVRSATPESVRAWWERLAGPGGAGVEVGVAGDVGLDETLRAADARLGALPPRPPPARMAVADPPARPRGPVVATARSEVFGPRAAVVRGCFGPDVQATDDLRALRVASRVLTDRLRRKLAPGPGQAAGPDAPGAALLMSAYPGFAMLAASAAVPEADAERAAREMEEELDRLATQGPAPEEVGPAGEALARLVESFERDPRYWSALLSRARTLGIDPETAAEAPAAYRAMDAARVREALARYWTPAGRIAVTLLPVRHAE